MSLSGRLALVTGGSRGIGAGIALEFARRGADVAITYTNNQSQAESVKDQIIALGRRSLVIKADQSTLDVGEIVLKGLKEEFGLGTEKKLDILMLNGGITGATPTLDWEVEKFTTYVVLVRQLDLLLKVTSIVICTRTMLTTAV